MSDGEYLDAFDTYADLCDEFLTQAKTGNAYDGDHMPKGAYPWLKKSADRTWKWRCDRTADRGRYEKKSEKCKNAAFGRKLCQSGKYAGDKTAGSFPVYQNKQKVRGRRTIQDLPDQVRIRRLQEQAMVAVVENFKEKI